MARKPPAETLEARLIADLRMTGGTMPICVILADEAERRRAERFVAGKKHARLLSFETAAEAAARRGEQ